MLLAVDLAAQGRLIRLRPDRPAAGFLDSALSPHVPGGRNELPDWLFIALSERADTFGDRLGRIKYDLAALGGTAMHGLKLPLTV